MRVAAICAALSIVLSSAPQDPSVVVLRARALVDVEAGTTLDDAAVVIRGGRIAAVGTAASIGVPAGAEIISLPKTTLLPGLIDTHVHLTLAGQTDANARATLGAGFTTVQDLGALGYANLALRDAIAAGRIEGPRVVAAGPWLGISGGICDFSGIGVRGADAFLVRVRQDVDRGVDLIKVCVSGWLAEAVAQPRVYEISDAELAAAVTEAHRLKRRVAAHAISEGGIDAALRHGVDLIVHGGFASPAAVALMREKAIFQSSTLVSLLPPGTDQALERHMRTAVSAGLPIVLGTDAGVIPHGTNAREFARLVGIGLTPAAAIRAATVDAARAVGLSGEIGLLKSGYAADVIGVEGAPLEDVRALEKVTFVMKGGRVVKR
jgi:imidazolonepropionase-like amidohydrolase